MQDRGYGLPRITLPKLSEKARRVLQRSPSDLSKASCVLRTLAKSTLGALLKPFSDGFSTHSGELPSP
jgi:hypothetical protein